LGIDLSARQIEAGQQTAASLGLRNIELRRADIGDVDAAYGSFDYIIAHGIYSWVPAPVRAKLLAICRDRLTPNGVAYVSYNTLPGWSSRGLVRELMVEHSHGAPDAVAKVRQSRAMLDFLSRSLPGDSAYAALLRDEVDLARREPDAYLYHDYLETVNEPVYFHQFIAEAEAHRMQFLAEAEFSMMTTSQLPPAVADGLSRFAPDVLGLQQYLDVLTNRTFRQTLLVHREAEIRRQPDGHSVQNFVVASPAMPASRAPSLTPGTLESFRAPNGATLNTGSALVKATLLTLQRAWPAAIALAPLLSAVQSMLAQGARPADEPIGDIGTLGEEILRCYAAGVVELRVWSPPLSTIVTERPVASPMARLQAQQGEHVTNLLQQRVTLDGITRALLPLLDGSRDRGALVRALSELAASGKLHLQQAGQLLTEGPALQALLVEAVSRSLPRLAKAALLVDPAEFPLRRGEGQGEGG
ncbi:MAG: class I SAM-dependent methyltransferase, partial [Betaproteobacteria bacterium]